MKIAAVIIDTWKLQTFKKHIGQAGFVYTEHPGVTNVTLTLKVHYEWVADLKPIIEAANTECASIREKK